MIGYSRGWQRAEITQRQDTIELRGAYLIFFIQFFVVDLVCLDKSADRKNDSLGITIRRGPVCGWGRVAIGGWHGDQIPIKFPLQGNIMCWSDHGV
jgi:hypothetical protein